MPRKTSMDIDKDIDSLFISEEVPETKKGKVPNPIYDKILDHALTLPNGSSFRIDTSKILSTSGKPILGKSVYVALHTRIYDKKAKHNKPKFKDLDLSFVGQIKDKPSSGTLYIVVEKKE